MQVARKVKSKSIFQRSKKPSPVTANRLSIG
jgi:hypothetical protein